MAVSEADGAQSDASVPLSHGALIEQLKSTQRIDRERAKLQLRKLLRESG